MYSRYETTKTILQFYQTIIRQPYLSSDALIVPPAGGWPATSINGEGKNETVVELLRHLSYLRSENTSEELTIHSECIPINYLDLDKDLQSFGLPLLPGHCVYLARAGSYLNTSLILDTESGTVIEYSLMANDITVSMEEYERLPEEDRWKAHPAIPVVELFDSWARKYEKLVWMLVPNPIGQPVTGRFYSRAAFKAEEEALLQQEGLLEPWHAQDERKHVADVYNLILQHGWLDHFEKERCRAELLTLEKTRDADERRKMDEANPDAALFD
ncbi:hypothetical protein BKA65DRAFT_180671 [Rhexocercosporidium sp. MPI-PUGE-AT-0058]|nr:hypothetical protein BKA65DRAFT_180671 [Rhexocercosporidium sp. MPI-PUGE-AT-0058]